MKIIITSMLLSLSNIALADGDLVAGKTVYEQSCVLCHGPKGKGDGMAAGSLNPKPKDFTNGAAMAKIPIDTRIKAVTLGGASVGASPVMPSFGEMLSTQQIQDVVAYIGTFAK
jgi:mono/diheme cytochrome c family protein